MHFLENIIGFKCFFVGRTARIRIDDAMMLKVGLSRKSKMQGSSEESHGIHMFSGATGSAHSHK